MSWGRHGDSASRSGRSRGIGAGAWSRRRRRVGAASFDYDAVGTADPTWLSLSLDGPSADPASYSLATVSLEEVGSEEAPELGDDALVVRQARPDVPTQPTLQDPTSSSPSFSSSSSSSSSSSLSISVSDPSASVSLEASVTSASGSAAVAPPGAFSDELTEALEVPLPLPVPVRLADEPLPWPLVLVPPTVVLPGSWPPPPGHLGESEPSGVLPQPSVSEEIALDDDDEVQELDLDAPSEDNLVSVVRPQQIEFEDSATDVVIEDPSVIESMPVLAGFQAADSIEEPPVRGTLDDMPVLDRSVPAPIPPEAPALSDLHEVDDDGPPTEVTDLNALEAALQLLRSSEGDDLSLAMDDVAPDEDPDSLVATAEDLLSLEFDGEVEQPVDPDVVADLANIGLPSADVSRDDELADAPGAGVFIELGGPSPAVVFSVRPAVWLETVDPKGASLIEAVAEERPTVSAAPVPGGEPDGTPTAPARVALPRLEPEDVSLELEPESASLELEPADESVELEPEDDSLELDLDDLEEPSRPALDEVEEDTLRVARPRAPHADPDESIDFVIIEGEGPATLTLEGDSVSEMGPLALDAEAGAIRVDLALGAPVPERNEATKGVAVAPPQAVRSWEGKTGAEQEERTTDLVALARLRPERGAPPPDSEVQRDLTASDDDAPQAEDDWLAELPEAPAGASEGNMSPNYEDTVPGWLPGPEGAGATRGGPRSQRPPAIAPLAPEPDTDVAGDE